MLLVFIPILIYVFSLIADSGKETQMEASFIAEPREIKVTDEAKGISYENYSKIFISYKNNTDYEITNLKIYIPKSVINDAGAGVKDFTDRKVDIDFAAARARERRHIVLHLPDIKPHSKQKVELMSFHSKISGTTEIKGELRSGDGLVLITNPVNVVVK
jgi:hypothetical protein